jgi:hypothetical protein
MWNRVNLNEFAPARRRDRSERPALLAPLHTEALTESGLVLAVMLTLALLAECVSRVTGLS